MIIPESVKRKIKTLIKENNIDKNDEPYFILRFMQNNYPETMEVHSIGDILEALYLY